MSTLNLMIGMVPKLWPGSALLDNPEAAFVAPAGARAHAGFVWIVDDLTLAAHCKGICAASKWVIHGSPWIIREHPWINPWIIHGYPWICHRYPWVIHGESMDTHALSIDNPWIRWGSTNRHLLILM